jgi:ABC-type antimicrobial peptide transport system permease subunit
MPLEKYITISHQKILRNMYFNGKKTNFFEQSIYKNYRSFERSMQQLKNANIIKIKNKQKGKQFIKEYSLTINGVIFIEEIINDFIKCNA